MTFTKKERKGKPRRARERNDVLRERNELSYVATRLVTAFSRTDRQRTGSGGQNDALAERRRLARRPEALAASVTALAASRRTDASSWRRPACPLDRFGRRHFFSYASRRGLQYERRCQHDARRLRACSCCYGTAVGTKSDVWLHRVWMRRRRPTASLKPAVSQCGVGGPSGGARFKPESAASMSSTATAR